MLCLACGAIAAHQPVLAASHPSATGEVIHFARCEVCSSLTAATSRFVEYTDEDGLQPAVWRHYLHVGAGIDFMVRPIERIRPEDAAPSLLDVGCGFGFTLDYWLRMTGAEVAGVEPADYGRVGRDMLGVPIHIAHLSDVAALRKRRFEIVFSSEVIEHVADPAVFLEELRAHLAPGGTLVLTTPRAEFIRPESPPGTVHAALSPGFHKLIFSAPALEAALRTAGFVHTLVEAQGERLVAFAADGPLHVRAAHETLSRRYLDYLLERAAFPDQPADLAFGFRFRAMKELVNHGRVLEAAPHAHAFAALVQKIYGYDPFDSAAIATRVLTVSSFQEYQDVAPFSLGPFLFYKGMAERVRGGDALHAAGLFTLAFDVLKHAVAVAPELAQEAASLVWICLMEKGCALLCAERREEAIAVFDAIETETANSFEMLGLVPPYVAARTAFERAVALLQLAKYPQAIAGFADAMARPAGTAEMRANAHRLLAEAADILHRQACPP
jgi:SAM-dependent methyltransferase